MRWVKALPRRLACALLLAPALVLAGADRLAAWRADGWYTDAAAAWTEARASGRPVFLYFHAPWCTWCQRYERETLRRPQVMAALRRHTVPLVLDYDSHTHLFARYGGRGLPFSVLLAAPDRVLTAFTGILGPEDLVRLVAAPAPRPPPPAAALRPAAPDARGLAAFRAAFLAHLDGLYDPEAGTLAGRYETGAGLKRSQPLTWLWLMEQGLWRERARRAAREEAARLLDRLDGGLFYYVDPHRPDRHLETAKLLEHNAWMLAWLSRSGEPAARRAAWSAWIFLREVLWDRDRCGFGRALPADAAYYALPPAVRLARDGPAPDLTLRADLNAQAALALLRAAIPAPAERRRFAAAALDCVLARLLADGHLHHLARGSRLSETRDLPADLLWVLAAGAAVQAAAPDAARAAKLGQVRRRAAAWIRRRLAAGTLPPDPALAPLLAYACAADPALPRACLPFAVRRLALAPDTRPDWLVPGLWGWARWLQGRGEWRGVRGEG